MRTLPKAALAALIALLLIAGAFLASALSSPKPATPGNLVDNPVDAPHPVEVLEVSDVPYEAPDSIEYPYGWLVTDEPSIGTSQGRPVRILYLPDIEVLPRVAGVPSDVGGGFVPSDPNLAYVVIEDEEESEPHAVDPTHLLVNLPDVLPGAVYDIRYAYDTPSRSGGHEIEGLTGAVLPGYVPEPQFDEYLYEESRPAPAAYGLAVKLIHAQAALAEDGYRLVVWDCYRPYQASRFISDRFTEAYAASPEIREAVGSTWGLSWYAADGTSGHNYGSDIDVSLADADGNVIPMPSDFDAFDDSAHLVSYPMSSSAITPSSYRQEVLGNRACMALHEAMASAGLSELASEWWHFADRGSESSMKGLVGVQGLDFPASLS